MRQVAIVLICVIAATTRAGGQEIASDRTPVSHFTLTAHTLGLTAGYARETRPGVLFGGEIGGGGDILSVMVLGGRHFGEFITFEERDASGGEELIELVHVGAFMRHVSSDRFDWDAGLRASAFLHFDDSDDDPGGGLFVGAYGTAFFGGRHFKIGPRIQAGVFNEGAGTSEFGVYLAPLTVRVTFVW